MAIWVTARASPAESALPPMVVWFGYPLATM